jgi:methyltransferase (TIGR00027 family)
MGRAVAHVAKVVPRFDDPTALLLLPDQARARAERVSSGTPPKTFRQRLDKGYLGRQSVMMATRTVAIDDALREARTPQVVILGAGLDGRAWRMPELGDAVVFEVDHPDTQRDKRARTAALKPTAREIRWVPVDFERDSLDRALSEAGHDPSLPTTWVWEGVVMYLTPADVEASLGVIAGRSASRSRLIILYFQPALMLAIVGLLVRRLGEPLRSSFTAERMRAMLSRHGFSVHSDEDLPTLARDLSEAASRLIKPMRHLRIVTADRP